MADARAYMIDSALSYRRSGENRLTELVATVLALHQPLAEGFVARAFGEGLDIAGARFEIRTQERTAPGCIPDLVVRVLRGGVIAQVWSEHKTDSPFRLSQREDYVQALRSAGVPGRLVTITRDDVPNSAGDWGHVSWQQLAQLFDEVGETAAGGPNWRQVAMRPEAAARDRLFAELLWYLEEGGFAVLRPLTHDHIRVLPRVDETQRVIAELVRGVREEMHGYDPGSEGTTWWFNVPSPKGAWVHRVPLDEVWCEVMISSVDDWWPQRSGDPAVAAGYTFAPHLYPRLAAAPGLAERLEDEGYTFDEWGNWLRCWRTRPLAEFVDAGRSVDAQAQAIAKWARGSIAQLGSLDPGPLEGAPDVGP